MATKLEKMAEKLNADFREVLKAEMKTRYELDIETGWNFMTGSIISTRVDGEEFSPE